MLVILDRDGVINQDSPDYIKSVEEWLPIKGSIDAIVRLKQAGVKVVVCTNQSGIARGLFGLEVLNELHLCLTEALGNLGVTLDGIYYCPHHPDDCCECRKPRPGMLLQAISEHCDIDETCYLVGDSLSDLQAATGAGCETLLVRTGKGRDTERRYPQQPHTRVFDDLSSAADWLLEKV